MDLQTVHIGTHEDAEMMALRGALTIRKMAVLMATLQEHLGKWVIFDPAAKIPEAVIKDGILAGRLVCDWMNDEMVEKGFSTDALDDLWNDMIGAGIARAAKTYSKGE